MGWSSWGSGMERSGGLQAKLSNCGALIDVGNK